MRTPGYNRTQDGFHLRKRVERHRMQGKPALGRIFVRYTRLASPSPPRGWVGLSVGITASVDAQGGGWALIGVSGIPVFVGIMRETPPFYASPRILSKRM